MNVTFHLHRGDADVKVDVLGASNRRFLAMRLSDDHITLYAPGEDAECIAWARDVAKKLTEAADKLEQSIPKADEVPA